MARTLSSPLHVARHTLNSDKAWLFFVEIPTSTGGFFRLVRNSRHVEANGVKWQAASIAIELPAEEAEGSLGGLSIAIANVSRIPMAYVEQDLGSTGRGELLGYTLTCWLQHESSLAVFDPALSWQHLIIRATATEATMRIECGHPAQIQRGPTRLFTRADFPQLLATGAS